MVKETCGFFWKNALRPMNGNWKDILANKEKIDQKKLMDYLQGKLSDAEKHEVESFLNDSPFLNDALEGLGEMKDKQKIATIISELDNQLKKRIQERKKKRKIANLYFPAWLVVATVTIIGLVVLAFVIYKMYMTR